VVIRQARFGDIPRLTELAHELHARSVYAGRATPDERAFKAMCVQAIQHMPKRTGVWVAERGGAVEGFLIGITDRIYGCLTEHYATDLMTYVSERGDARAAAELLDALIAWAETLPHVIEVQLGVNGSVGDWRRTAKLYERKRFGLSLNGALYVRRIER
jgi:hypothetical protein